MPQKSKLQHQPEFIESKVGVEGQTSLDHELSAELCCIKDEKKQDATYFQQVLQSRKKFKVDEIRREFAISSAD